MSIEQKFSQLAFNETKSETLEQRFAQLVFNEAKTEVKAEAKISLDDLVFDKEYINGSLKSFLVNHHKFLDKKHVESPLLTLSEIFKNKLNVALPIKTDGMIYLEGTRGFKTTLPSPEVCLQRAKAQFDPLRSLPGFKKKFIVAGGAICSLLINTNINDVDIYPVNCPNLLVNLVELTQHLFKWWNSHGYYMSLNRTKNVLTLIFHPKEKSDNAVKDICKKYQIIVKQSSSISKILYEFDLGPSQVAFDGDEFYFTNLAWIAYVYNVMILNLRGFYHHSSEARVYKYFYRGFTLVNPYFNNNLSPAKTQPFGSKLLVNGNPNSKGGKYCTLRYQPPKEYRTGTIDYDFDAGNMYGNFKAITMSNFKNIKSGKDFLIYSKDIHEEKDITFNNVCGLVKPTLSGIKLAFESKNFEYIEKCLGLDGLKLYVDSLIAKTPLDLNKIVDELERKCDKGIGYTCSDAYNVVSEQEYQKLFVDWNKNLL